MHRAHAWRCQEADPGIGSTDGAEGRAERDRS
jgi:hypothetical protein